MNFTIDELTQETGTPSSTIRYYQSQGLLQAPIRVGRRARYGEEHLNRLRTIERLKKRGFSLAGLRQLLEGHNAGADLESVLGLGHTRTSAGSERESLHDMVLATFPEGIEAGPIRVAMDLGVLTVNNGQVEMVDEAMRPMVVGLLRLFHLGLPEGPAVDLWALVTSHIGAIASEFHHAAETYVYAERTPGESAAAMRELIEAAHEIVVFALMAALRENLISGDTVDTA